MYTLASLIIVLLAVILCCAKEFVTTLMVFSSFSVIPWFSWFQVHGNESMFPWEPELTAPWPRVIEICKDSLWRQIYFLRKSATVQCGCLCFQGHCPEILQFLLSFPKALVGCFLEPRKPVACLEAFISLAYQYWSVVMPQETVRQWSDSWGLSSLQQRNIEGLWT